MEHSQSPFCDSHCALLEAFGSAIPEAERVEIILAGISSEFDVILTLASFLTKALPLQKLVDALLEFESRQSRTVSETFFHANLVNSTSTPLVADSVSGGVCFLPSAWA